MVARRFLPYELIVECCHLLFPPSFFERGVIIEKPAWKTIEGLTLASKETREIILTLWFHVLRISDLDDWNAVLRNWTRLYQWTRAIHYTSTVYKTPRYLLEPFLRLNSLRIDLPTTHETGEGDFDFAAPEVATIIHDGIPAKIIQHLEIRGITWLDPFVMRHIAEGVPNLRTLRLKQPLVWCGLCNTIGAPSFKIIPDRMVYDDGTGLPDGYSRYLAPLNYLHTVTLTVTCGEGDIAYDSLFSNGTHLGTIGQHSSNLPATNPPTRNPLASEQPTSMTSYSPNSSARKYLGWSGECDSCMSQLLDDATFREAWLARREGARTAAEDGLPPRKSRPPSLRRVEWNLLELSNQNWPGLLPTHNVPNNMYYM